MEPNTEQISLHRLHRKYIKNTAKEAIVTNSIVYLCNLTFAVQKGINISEKKTYINTRVVKHIYDKRPAQEYDFLLNNISIIVKYPNDIYENKNSKRAGYCFVKSINEKKYLVVIECDNEIEGIHIVTAFGVGEKYLKNFHQIWSWEGGYLHRNTLDATVK